MTHVFSHTFFCLARVSNLLHPFWKSQPRAWFLSLPCPLITSWFLLHLYIIQYHIITFRINPTVNHHVVNPAKAPHITYIELPQTIVIVCGSPFRNAQDQRLLPQDGRALPQGQPSGARDASQAPGTHGLSDGDGQDRTKKLVTTEPGDDGYDG